MHAAEKFCFLRR